MEKEHRHQQNSACHCHDNCQCQEGDHEACHCHDNCQCHKDGHEACDCHEHGHGYGTCQCQEGDHEACQCHENDHDNCHCHHHAHGSGRRRGYKILLAALLLAAAVLVERKTPWASWQHLLLYLIPYLVAGWGTLREAGEGLLKGKALNEHFLMSIATLGALGIGFLPGAQTQFPEAVFVMLFFQLGEWFEGKAEGNSRKSISHLLDIRPDTAHVQREGRLEAVHPKDVMPGEIILVQPGERVPLDGLVLEGKSSLDTVALTGESVPRSIRAGEEILSGCVNLSGVLKVKTTKAFGASTAARILQLVEHAASAKSSSERFITRFARIYTPVVVILAVLTALVPGFITGAWAGWIYRGLLFLVVSCPCALVLSVPLTFFGGLGGASKKGILIKGSNYLETLSRVKTVVFDKTGTLTEGVFEVSVVHPERTDREELLHLAAHVERHSTHPVAMALRNAYPAEADDCRVEEIQEYAGQGIVARVNGQKVAVGNAGLMEKLGAAFAPCPHEGTLIHVAVDGRYAGHIVISDRIKQDAAQAIEALRREGVRKTVMLTGDQQDVAARVASALKLDAFHARLLPADKVAQVERLLPEGILAFVGDGINDAPVLTRADLGIAMGALGADAAIEAADVVLMDDKLSLLAQAVRMARKTLLIARENIVFAIGIKLLVLILSALGLASMGMAVFADVGVTVLAVINAMRALKG